MPRYYEAETIAGLIKAYTMGDEFKRMAMLESLSNSQTADVVEVKHGKWIYHTDALPMSPYGHYECSECGQLIAHQENYCPKCGAKMQKGGAE